MIFSSEVIELYGKSFKMNKWVKFRGECKSSGNAKEESREEFKPSSGNDAVESKGASKPAAGTMGPWNGRIWPKPKTAQAKGTFRRFRMT